MLNNWYRWAGIERGLAPRTIATYLSVLRELAIAKGPLLSLTTDDLRAYLYERPGSASRVANRIAAMRSFYKFAIRADHIEKDPSARLDRPKVHRGLPRPVENVAELIGRLDPEYRAIATFLLETGLRISEATAVRQPVPVPADLIVRGKGSKERTVPLTLEARMALEFLGGAIRPSVRSIERRFQELGFSPHRLRHSFACRLADDGVDLLNICTLLGHANPATTMVYTKNSPARLREALEGRRRS